MSKDNDENKIAPPVELTDEEMEQAAGGQTDNTVHSIPVPSDGRIISWTGYANGVVPSFEDFKCQHCSFPSRTYAKRKLKKTLDNLDPNRAVPVYGNSLTYYGYEDCWCFACGTGTEYYLIDRG